MILSQTDNLKYPCKLNRLILAVQARYRLGHAAKGLYQHYAVIEEEFLVKMTARYINERSYPWDDYQKSQSKIKNALKKAREAIIAELNTIIMK
ncbi:MAG: hypothetical protein GXY86_17040 [Firmicutes bacterium]|nr:hypothetical protein [Bacillota bacterium]